MGLTDALTFMFFLLSVYVVYFAFFFFSSRRRHTRCYRDWSSDVCSSDLPKHDAGNGDRRGREKAERAIAPDGAARGEIGNHQRQDGADGGRGHAKHEGVLDGKLSGRQFEEYEMDVVQREIVERHERGGDAGERGIEQRAIG